tara:strand:- start:455 stop:634 length:180 start_codon:yes stop_codon:yes gene_type:complete
MKITADEINTINEFLGIAVEYIQGQEIYNHKLFDEDEELEHWKLLEKVENIITEISQKQ